MADDLDFDTLLDGRLSLARGQTSALVVLVQRALQAVAARFPGAPSELALPVWGADAVYGGEVSAAVEALKAWRALGSGGESFGHVEARALLDLFEQTEAPDLFAPIEQHPQQSAGAQRLVEIANAICDATGAAPCALRSAGKTYTYTAAHFGVPGAEKGTLTAPGGVGYGTAPGSNEYWKCNIFAGSVIALAELPVPTFAVGRYQHFPRAERFGAKLARKPGWRLVSHLDHRDPADPTVAVSGPAYDAEIEALLDAMQPGDLFFVDHPGEPRGGGGHCRVCVAPAREGDPNHAPAFAQAREDAARVERDGIDELGGGNEIQFWQVRYEG